MFQFNIEKEVNNPLFKENRLWDLIIIGGGPAGLNAALYAKRKGLMVGLVSKNIGGQLHNTTMVDNYLGLNDISGEDLSNVFLTHVKRLDVPIYQEVYVESINKKDHVFNINLSSGEMLQSKTILITTGGNPRKLEVPGENEFANKGVSYCATCDAPFFKDKHVIVAGGGNSAAEAVIDLSKWASKVTVVHRSQWRADRILLEKLQAIPGLTVHLNTQIQKVNGNPVMTSLTVLDKTMNKSYDIEADGLFIEIGLVPNSQLVKNLVKLNEKEEIIVDENQMTSLDGLFAAGDVTNQPHKQIIISASEGAKAALSITQYINTQYKGE
ncbi:MAG: FAD-dependent oxidoreductase [Acholeplasmataceae bacterium]|nr:FAD-dependent oxidoreductase [Acholeplasmataceae bacterium]